MVGERQFRDLMASVCAPVTIVTTAVGETPYGATVSSFTSLSLRPPLVSVAFDRASSLLKQIQATRRFGVSILSHAQDDLALVFARRDVDRFAAVGWSLDNGLPRLADAPAWMACDLYQTVGAGDHLLLFGLVRSATSRADLPPLVYVQRTFGTHSRFADRPRPAIADLIAACSR